MTQEEQIGLVADELGSDIKKIAARTISPAPGPGWVLTQTPEGATEWVEPLALPGLHGLDQAGAGGWAKNGNSGGNGMNAELAYAGGGEAGFLITPAIGGGSNDGRFVQTGDLVRVGPSDKRLTVTGRLAITALNDATLEIRGGLGLTTADPGQGWPSPPFGGYFAVVNFERSPTNSTALYAATCRNNTVSRVMLVDNVVANRSYTVSVTLNGDGSITYRVDNQAPYTETSASFLPTGVKLGIGFFCNRRSGASTGGVRFFQISAYKRASLS